MNSMTYRWKWLAQKTFDGEAVAAPQAPEGFYQKAARFGLLSFAGIVAGTLVVGVAKVVALSARFLGFSAYSGHTISRALKKCANFVFGTEHKTDAEDKAIKDHIDRDPPTWEDQVDRSWFGFNRLINGCGYAMSVACGVSGFTVHSMNSMVYGWKWLARKAFGGDPVQAISPAAAIGSIEWFARAGLLGIAGIVAGAAVICVVKGLSWLGRAFGISSYGGHLISRALKRCANFVLGTDYKTDTENTVINAPVKTWKDRADWLAIFPRILSGVNYVVSGLFGVVGLTAANYHRAAMLVKNIKNMFKENKADEISVAQHENFLQKMAKQNTFTHFTSCCNVIRGVAATIKYGMWFAGAAVAFAARRVWKLTLGNLFGNACGTDGAFNSSSNMTAVSVKKEKDQLVAKINQRFRDLLWCLKPEGDLPERSEGVRSGDYKAAIDESKEMSLFEKIRWRMTYEFRKCASIFSLDTAVEKVILHFASTFQQYVNENKNSGNLGDKVALTFIG